MKLEELSDLSKAHPFHLLEKGKSITIQVISDADAEKMRGMLERRFPHKYRLTPSTDGFTFTRIR